MHSLKNNLIGLKLFTRLSFGLSHINEHRFNHNFQCRINPLCSCSLKVKSTTNFYLTGMVSQIFLQHS